MRDLSYVLAFFAAVFMLVAAAAWWKIVRVAAEDRAAEGVGIDSRQLRAAAKATVIAFGLSGMAALLGVIDRIVR